MIIAALFHELFEVLRYSIPSTILTNNGHKQTLLHPYASRILKANGSWLGLRSLRLSEKKMNKILIALSLVAFAMTSTAQVYAADKPCSPAKQGYHLDDKGKCVKDTKKKM